MRLEFRHDGTRILLDLSVMRASPATDMTSVPVRALLDTGATRSGIARATAQHLGLPARGKFPINTAGGVVQSTRYLFRIGVPQDSGFPFVFDDLLGFELLPDHSFDALLGMDVLRRCDLRLRRDGTGVIEAG